ncbi:MAG TPA: hypothetical protein DEX10_12855 [Betaproteobacteria bacterium]|jgi:hypothetical protein|nr:hypothetical protein [Betaproteobacteria bacterium]
MITISMWDNRHRSVAFLLCAAALLAGCSSASTTRLGAKPDRVAAFSLSQLGEPHPLEWQPWVFSRFNRRTDYRVIEMDGRRVLRAQAQTAASGLLQEIEIDPLVSRHLKWHWSVPQLLPEADLSKKGSDDSPVRMIVSFDGDLAKLDVEDRAMAGMVKMVSGREMPYATLMYVWDNKLPIGTFLDSPHSSRVKLIVVESGSGRLGKWVSYSRNLVADFKRAFGEMPEKIITVGVMTDTNATEKDATAYYGDIEITTQE